MDTGMQLKLVLQTKWIKSSCCIQIAIYRSSNVQIEDNLVITTIRNHTKKNRNAHCDDNSVFSVYICIGLGSYAYIHIPYILD